MLACGLLTPLKERCVPHLAFLLCLPRITQGIVVALQAQAMLAASVTRVLSEPPSAQAHAGGDASFSSEPALTEKELARKQAAYRCWLLSATTQVLACLRQRCTYMYHIITAITQLCHSSSCVSQTVGVHPPITSLQPCLVWLAKHLVTTCAASLFRSQNMQTAASPRSMAPELAAWGMDRQTHRSGKQSHPWPAKQGWL